VTETEAHDLIATYLDTMPKVKLWYFNERSKALSGDKITETMAGRLRLLDKTKSKRGKWYVEPSLRLNTPVQGSAGDGFKYAAALAHERLAECPGRRLRYSGGGIALSPPPFCVGRFKNFCSVVMLEDSRHLPTRE
jgi:DNA polymerase I-like protein with 3'-5' exonuclease and polymerase domains